MEPQEEQPEAQDAAMTDVPATEANESKEQDQKYVFCLQFILAQDPNNSEEAAAAEDKAVIDQAAEANADAAMAEGAMAEEVAAEVPVEAQVTVKQEETAQPDQSNDTQEKPAEDKSAASMPAIPVDVRLLLSVSEAEHVDPKMVETLEKDAKVEHASLGPYTRGAVERVLHLRGPPTAVSAACIMLASKFRQSEEDNLVLRMIVPESAVLRGDFAKLARNQTDVKIHVSQSPLPMTLERSVAIIGETSDKLELGINLMSVTLIACQPIVKSLPEVNYTPRSVAGIYGHPETFRRQALNAALVAQNTYITGQTPAPSAERNGAAVEAPQEQDEGLPNISTDHGLTRAKQMVMKMMPGQPSTLQVYVPTDVVGAIIGKGGSKINDIRATSGAMVRVNETQGIQDTQTERLMVMSGTPETIKVALMMVSQKIETERHFQSRK